MAQAAATKETQARIRQPKKHLKTRLALHTLALASLTNSFRLLFELPTLGGDEASGGKWAFLTVDALGASWLVFAFALLGDVFPSVRLFDTLKTAVATVAVPVEGIVSVLYWSLIAIDPALLVPPDPRYAIPLALDVSLHLLPALFLWLDFLCFSPPMSDAVHPGIIATVATLAYCAWMERNAARNGGAFPYPFLDSLESLATQRVPFYVLNLGVLIGLFRLANFLHRRVNHY